MVVSWPKVILPILDHHLDSSFLYQQPTRSSFISLCTKTGVRTRFPLWKAEHPARIRAGEGQDEHPLPSVGVEQPKAGLAPCRLLTCIGGPVGERQVGPCSPGPGAKVLLALAAVLPRGVVLALALEAALFEGAQVGVEVAFTPGGRRQGRAVRCYCCSSLPPV